jgi:Tol biopolymer transport system component
VTFPEGILFRANRDGSNPVQLTNPPLNPTILRWSPDGARILFCAQDAAGHWKIYLLSSGGGPPQMLLPEDHEPQSDADWSPDGRKIVFASSAPGWMGSHSEAKVLDLSSHRIWTLPGSEGTRAPSWSPDGRFISVNFGDEGLKVFDLSTQRWSVLREAEVTYARWSRDSQFIYFVTYVHDLGVYRIRVTGGDVERLVDLTDFRHTGFFGLWFELDPTDTPMLLQDVGTVDIYGITLETN